MGNHRWNDMGFSGSPQRLVASFINANPPREALPEQRQVYAHYHEKSGLVYTSHGPSYGYPNPSPDYRVFIHDPLWAEAGQILRMVAQKDYEDAVRTVFPNGSEDLAALAIQDLFTIAGAKTKPSLRSPQKPVPSDYTPPKQAPSRTQGVQGGTGKGGGEKPDPYKEPRFYDDHTNVPPGLDGSRPMTGPGADTSISRGYRRVTWAGRSVEEKQEMIFQLLLARLARQVVSESPESHSTNSFSVEGVYQWLVGEANDQWRWEDHTAFQRRRESATVDGHDIIRDPNDYSHELDTQGREFGDAEHITDLNEKVCLDPTLVADQGNRSAPTTANDELTTARRDQGDDQAADDQWAVSRPDYYRGEPVTEPDYFEGDPDQLQVCRPTDRPISLAVDLDTDNPSDLTDVATTDDLVTDRRVVNPSMAPGQDDQGTTPTSLPTVDDQGQVGSDDYIAQSHRPGQPTVTDQGEGPFWKPETCVDPDPLEGARKADRPGDELDPDFEGPPPPNFDRFRRR